MTMNIDEEVGIQADCQEYDGEAPVVSKCIAEYHWLWTEPTPIATDWSVCIHPEPSRTCPAVSITANQYF